MRTQSAVAAMFVAGALVGWTILPTEPALGQGAAPPALGGVEGPPAGRVVPERRNLPVETEADFLLWKRKAQLELDVLQAQVEAKKAEIGLREAEYRAKAVGRDLAILTKLEMPVRMPFARETPLEDVLKYIKKATTGANDNGIPIYIDPVGLQEAEKTMTSPVTLDLDGVPLKTSLRLVLKQLGLVFDVNNGLLTITSEVECGLGPGE